MNNFMALDFSFLASSSCASKRNKEALVVFDGSGCRKIILICEEESSFCSHRHGIQNS